MIDVEIIFVDNRKEYGEIMFFWFQKYKEKIIEKATHRIKGFIQKTKQIPLKGDTIMIAIEWEEMNDFYSSDEGREILIRENIITDFRDSDISFFAKIESRTIYENYVLYKLKFDKWLLNNNKL